MGGVKKCHGSLEVVSDPQPWFESKTPADEKTQHTLMVCEHFEEAGNKAKGPG